MNDAAIVIFASLLTSISSGESLWRIVILNAVKFRRTVFKSGDSYCITIPMEIVRALDIKEKEPLEIWLNDSQIIIEKIKQ